MTKDEQPARMIVSLKWDETSGVDHPANEAEGWAIMKAAGAAEPKLMTEDDLVPYIRKAMGYSEGGGVTETTVQGAIDFFCMLLDPENTGAPLPDKVRANAQAIVDFLRGVIPAPIVKDDPVAKNTGLAGFAARGWRMR